VKTYLITYIPTPGQVPNKKIVKADRYTVMFGQYIFYIGDDPVYQVSRPMVDKVEDVTMQAEEVKKAEIKKTETVESVNEGLGEAKFKTKTLYGLFNVLVGTRQVVLPEDKWLFDTPFQTFSNRDVAMDYYKEHHTDGVDESAMKLGRRIPKVRLVEGRASYYAIAELREQITEMHIFPWQNA
jgi:hypothetical protein